MQIAIETLEKRLHDWEYCAGYWENEIVGSNKKEYREYAKQYRKEAEEFRKAILCLKEKMNETQRNR